MRSLRRVGLPVLIASSWLPAACLPEPEPALDEATVIGDNTSVRIDATASARTLFTLDAGDRVSIMEKRDSWYRVRDPDLLEGWMDESTVIRDATRQAMSDALAEAAETPVQNTARATEAVNLRLAPGRDTDVVRRLRRGTTMEVLDRTTTPRPNSEATDIWFQVRPSTDEIGWVYAQLIEFDVPGPLQAYTEDRLYTAVFPLREVEDPEVGIRRWFLVAERRETADAEIAFDGIRVFVWNLDEHEYETTLRLRNLRGALPIEVNREGDQASFRVPTVGDDGARLVREFAMRGTIPREVR
jgi:uncharacterized protein YgiM (DUF1202 family)